jgi:FAD/FMN-containing dehydrogenase
MELGEEELEKFQDRLLGDVILRSTPGYDEARGIWNGMIDKHPALIVRCTGPADVMESVNFAREHQLLFSVRGGGHNVAGNSLVEEGMVIDLSAMRSVRVDPQRRLARAEGGATLGDMDRETQAFGLATPVGLVSRTGVAGLTLGGGFGWLTRRYGLSADSLRSVDIVTADGKLHTASQTENTDLFWAIRGGGGNFGIVTSFEYELYPIGPEVMLTATFYPAEMAASGMRYFRDFMREAPDELFGLAVLWSMPEGPDFPSDRAGEPVLVFVGVYSGDVEEGKRVMEPLRTFDEPLADLSGPVSWLDAQTFYDEDYPDGMLYYWKSVYLDDVSNEAIEALVDTGVERPSVLSNVDLWYLGGAMEEVAPDSTAFWYRNVEAMIGIEANWKDPAQSDANIEWARDLVTALQPHASDGSYANFGGFQGDTDNPARKIYGGNYERLVEIKRRYDPDNLFRLNHNIEPADRV